jgi:hypothetical protein
MSRRLLVCLTLASWLAAGRLTAIEPVRTSLGSLEGTTTYSGVTAFLGVPYAAPPVEQWRWRPPQPPSPWEGVREAKAFGPRCVQHPVYDDMIFRDEMSEDCLYLNVWTPSPGGEVGLPVMVWIYGGGFQAGSASEPRQDGTLLAEQGVVVVSLNYRLGVFGFLAHPEMAAEPPEGAAGNHGLHDMVAALRWVHKAQQVKSLWDTWLRIEEQPRKKYANALSEDMVKHGRTAAGDMKIKSLMNADCMPVIQNALDNADIELTPTPRPESSWEKWMNEQVMKSAIVHSYDDRNRDFMLDWISRLSRSIRSHTN